MSAPIYPPTTPSPALRPAPKQRKRWPYIAAIPVALFIGIGLGNAGDTAPAATSTAPVTITAPAPDPVIVKVDPDVRDTNRFPEPGTQAQPTGPLTMFSDGTYEVGTGDGQVAPGKYKSPGPGYYARLKSNDGEVADIIKNDFSQGQMLMTVQKTDKYVTVTGCTFTKV